MISGRSRGFEEQPGVDGAGGNVGGECRFVHLYLDSFLVEARFMYIFILYVVIFSLKVRGARLMREMEKPEDEEEVEEDDEDPEEEEGAD